MSDVRSDTDEMLEKMDVMLKAVGEHKVLNTIAKTYRVLYDSLTEEGFSRDEAMAIITTQGLGVKTE